MNDEQSAPSGKVSARRAGSRPDESATPKPTRKGKGAQPAAIVEQSDPIENIFDSVEDRLAAETTEHSVGSLEHDADFDVVLSAPEELFEQPLTRSSETARTRRVVSTDDEEVVVGSSYFEQLLQPDAALLAGEEGLDGDEDSEDGDTEGDVELLDALHDPGRDTFRAIGDAPLTSADYNDRNQALFARRNALLGTIAGLEGKKRPSARDTDELRKARFELDTATHNIVMFNYGLVLNYVRKFTSTTSKDDSADFEASGIVGLMRAVKSYDPTRGTKFSTWAYKPIQREILKAVRDADFKQLNPGDFEKRPDILRAVKELQKGNDEFIPTFEAVAAQAGATLDAVKRILNAPIIDSLSAPMGEDGDTSLTDMIEDPSAGVEDMALARQEILDLEQFGLSSLDGRELFVIGRRFGLDGEPPQRLSAIGTLLGLSREAVRQVEAKALSKLLHPVTRRRLVRHGRR